MLLQTKLHIPAPRRHPVVRTALHRQLDKGLAHPVSRLRFFCGKVLALVLASLAIALIGWISFSVLPGNSRLGVTGLEMLVPFLPLLAQAILYSSIALPLSEILPARHHGTIVAGVVMFVSYLASSLVAIDERLEAVGKLMPFS